MGRSTIQNLAAKKIQQGRGKQTQHETRNNGKVKARMLALNVNVAREATQGHTQALEKEEDET
jgi:hypothetical protein